ncbi:hypothetical protein PIB30_020339 [Stylosanthes scabra]|uniref:Uncharacterized protein n=1 Tax=Stylosanthes scabra TaxID=79078 RepID=A0ABU6Y855_9FABA|nr:hypothetical protein [Stylosanthes scabra]
MGPRKDTQKRRRQDGEGSSRRHEQVQQIHPLASWFNNSKALETFINKWERRQFVSPRYTTFDFLVGHNYRRLIEVIENQGFGTLITMQNDYYPDLAIASMSHLKYSPFNQGGYIEGYIAGRYRVVPLATIANLCGLSMEGHRFMGGINPHESWGPYQLRTGLNKIGYNDPRIGKHRLSVHMLSTEMDPSLSHYLHLATSCLQGRESKHVGYGPVWTRIFEYLQVNLQGYTKIQMGENNLINDRTLLRQMRREQEQAPQGVDEVEEEINRMEHEEQQQPPLFEAQAGSSEQPSMRDMMEILQRMELNQQSLDNRFDSFEQGQERMDRQLQRLNSRIQRIEHKLEIDEVENEDQE